MDVGQSQDFTAVLGRCRNLYHLSVVDRICKLCSPYSRSTSNTYTYAPASTGLFRLRHCYRQLVILAYFLPVSVTVNSALVRPLFAPLVRLIRGVRNNFDSELFGGNRSAQFPMVERRTWHVLTRRVSGATSASSFLDFWYYGYGS